MNFKNLLLLNLLTNSFMLTAQPDPKISEQNGQQKLITLDHKKLFVLLVKKNLEPLEIFVHNAHIETTGRAQLLKAQINNITAFMVENFGKKSFKNNNSEKKSSLKALFKKPVNSFQQFAEKQELTTYKNFINELNELFKNPLSLKNSDETTAQVIPSHNFAHLIIQSIHDACQITQDTTLSSEDKDKTLNELMNNVLLHCNPTALKKLSTVLKDYCTNLSDSKKLETFARTVYTTLLPTQKNLIVLALNATTDDLKQLQLNDSPKKSNEDEQDKLKK